MVRAVLVTATSLALTGAVVAHAYLLKHQFYPTVVYLTKSSPSMAVRLVQNKSQILNVFFRKIFFSHHYFENRIEHLPCGFPMLSGVVYSGLCVGVPPGKVHEEGLFWTAKGGRNGGTLLSVFIHITCFFSKCLVIWPIFAIVQHRQHLIERSWYAVTETCLAFTVFRDDFSPRFVALFTLLLFLKCFHWLAEDRVDFVSDTLIYTDTSRAKCHIFELKCLQLLFFKYVIRWREVQIYHGFSTSEYCVSTVYQ